MSKTKGKQARCKNCGRVMENAHPNKKFCSNKGKGNCKDAYHNSKDWGGDEFEAGHPFSAGYFGHGQE